MKRFILRSKVQVENVTSTFEVSTVWRQKQSEDFDPKTVNAVRDERTQTLGWRILHRAGFRALARKY